MRRCQARLLTTVVLAAGAVVASSVPVGAASSVSTRRLAGADRYQTAAVIAQDTFPARTDRERRTQWTNVARGDAFPDALAAVNFQGGFAPILLTAQDDLPRATADALRTLGPANVMISGQPDVVSERVRQQIADVIGAAVNRIGGNDRYATAAELYKGGYNYEGRVPGVVDGLRTGVVASGLQYADAMSAGPLSYEEHLPLLLTAPDRLPEATKTGLLYDGGLARENFGLEQVIVVGGPAAVSDSVVRQIEALGIVVRRVAGASRQQTAISVFEFAEAEFGWEASHVNLARGDGFADAIAGGPHAGEEQAPILLTVGVNDLGAATRDFLRRRSATVSSIDVFGDRTAVSDAVVEDARRAATS